MWLRARTISSTSAPKAAWAAERISPRARPRRWPTPRAPTRENISLASSNAMQRSELNKLGLPDVPGVYLFKQGRKVLYVGKATSLRDRVRSYFDNDLIATRGPRIVDMVTKADRLSFETTPTVLEALVREAALIKEHMPKANVDGKDDKTFLYAAVTDEEIPRVLILRGKDIDFKAKEASDGQALKALYGPFPSGAQLREGLRLIRRIFPFFDTPKPVGAKSKHQAAKIEFNTQIRQ